MPLNDCVRIVPTREVERVRVKRPDGGNAMEVRDSPHERILNLCAVLEFVPNGKQCWIYFPDLDRVIVTTTCESLIWKGGDDEGGPADHPTKRRRPAG